MRTHLAAKAIEKFVHRAADPAPAAQRRYEQFLHPERGEAIEICGQFSGWRENSPDVTAGFCPFRGETHVDTMGYRKIVERAAPALGDLANPGETLGVFVGCQPRTVPSVTQLDRAAYGAPAEPAHPNRDRSLLRPGRELHPAEVEELTLEFRQHARPKRPHQPDGFVGIRPAPLIRCVECAKFRFKPSA